MDNKSDIFKKVAAMATEKGFTIVQKDDERPWGGFYVIDELQAMEFASYFFPQEDWSNVNIAERLTPKFLIVEAGKKLSWQYHHRRREIWKCIDGSVEVATSDTDMEKERWVLKAGDVINIAQGMRHRLIGLDNWAVIAEIWRHTDITHMSDEYDIVRLQDDFGRDR